MDVQGDLARLLAEDDVDEFLNARRPFDPFRDLQIEEYEVRHTTALGWLLDPSGSHGLRTGFLDAFLRNLAASLPAVGGFETAGATVLNEVPLVERSEPARFEEVDPQSRWRFGTGAAESVGGEGEEGRSGRKRLDVLVEGLAGGAGWSIAIEAKVKAKEGAGQLKRYRSALHDRREPVRSACLFLTLRATEPKDLAWKNITWLEHVAAPLEQVLARPGVDEEVRRFLEHYLALIERLSGKSSDPLHAAATALAAKYGERVVRARMEHERLVGEHVFEPVLIKHRSLLRLIFRNALNERGRLAADMVRALREDGGGVEVVGRIGADGFVDFLPDAWLPGFGATADERRRRASLVVYHLEVKADGTVEVKIWLPPNGPTTEQEALWDGIRGKHPTLRGRGRFGNSGKLFSQNFHYERTGEGLRLTASSQEAWRAYVGAFAQVTRQQWPHLSAFL